MIHLTCITTLLMIYIYIYIHIYIHIYLVYTAWYQYLGPALWNNWVGSLHKKTLIWLTHWLLGDMSNIFKIKLPVSLGRLVVFSFDLQLFQGEYYRTFISALFHVYYIFLNKDSLNNMHTTYYHDASIDQNLPICFFLSVGTGVFCLSRLLWKNATIPLETVNTGLKIYLPYPVLA